MRKLMMICGLLFGMTTFSQAQQNGKPADGAGRQGMNPEAKVKQFDEKLKLSDDQKAKLTDIFTAQAEMHKKQREAGKSTEDKQTRMENMQKQRVELETKISDVLNNDQKVKYTDWMVAQKAERQNKMEKRKAAGAVN